MECNLHLLGNFLKTKSTQSALQQRIALFLMKKRFLMFSQKSSRHYFGLFVKNDFVFKKVFPPLFRFVCKNGQRLCKDFVCNRFSKIHTKQRTKSNKTSLFFTIVLVKVFLLLLPCVEDVAFCKCIEVIARQPTCAREKIQNAVCIQTSQGCKSFAYRLQIFSYYPQT